MDRSGHLVVVVQEEHQLWFGKELGFERIKSKANCIGLIGITLNQP